MVLDATTGALSDMNTRRRVLKLVRQASRERSAIKKSSQNMNDALETIVIFEDPFEPIGKLIKNERGTAKPEG